MSLTDKIRSVLQKAETPLSVDMVMDALPTGTERNTVTALLSQRKEGGEFVSCFEEGRVCYSTAPNPSETSKAAVPSPQPVAAMPAKVVTIERAREPVVTKEVTSAPSAAAEADSKKRTSESVDQLIDVTQWRIFAIVLGDTADSTAAALESTLLIGGDPELTLLLHRCHIALRAKQVRILTEIMEPA